MKKYILISILSVFISCEKFLDKTDPTATTFVEFFNNEEDLRRVVYSSYLDVFTSNERTLVPYMFDGNSDNAYSRVEGHHHQRIANGDYNSNTSAFLYYYENHMKHLGRLNTFIANAHIPYVEDEAVRQKYKSILEALRIWHYFKLTQVWGNVPFLLEPANLTTALQPPKAKEEILDILFPLAVEVANRLPKEVYSTNRYMFNQYSLKALTARYALYNKRYDLAIQLCTEIIESKQYNLHPAYKDLFQYTGHRDNKEFIILRNQESSGASYTFQDLGPHYRDGKGESYLVPLKGLVDAYWTLQGLPIEKCNQGHTRDDYELNPKLNRDPRYEASIFGHGDDFYNEIVNIYDENSPMFHEKTRASRSGYWFRKFVDDADAFKGSGTMELPILRYAEILLTYAEAKIMLNQVDNKAKDYINAIRSRAGLDMTYADVTKAPYTGYTQEQWIELIRNERRIELAGEGLRYDDILRWGIAEKVLNGPAEGHTKIVSGKKESLKIENRVFDKNANYRWPFHENSLKVEPALIQNPGY